MICDPPKGAPRLNSSLIKDIFIGPYLGSKAFVEVNGEETLHRR